MDRQIIFTTDSRGIDEIDDSIEGLNYLQGKGPDIYEYGRITVVHILKYATLLMTESISRLLVEPLVLPGQGQLHRLCGIYANTNRGQGYRTNIRFLARDSS